MIDDEAFFNANISNICFAENSNIKKIASRAFYNCKELTSFKNGLPFGLETIGDEAFVGCDNLKEIIIPKTVKNIGNSIFNNPNIVIICEQGSPIYDYCKKNNLQISELEKNVTLSLPETKEEVKEKIEEVKENIIEISSNNVEKETVSIINEKNNIKSEINEKQSVENKSEKTIINNKEIDSNTKDEDKNNEKKKRLDWRILIITLLIAKFILGLDTFTSTLIGLVIAFIVKWYKNK